MRQGMMKVRSVEVDTRPDHDGMFIMVRGIGRRSGKCTMLMRMNTAVALSKDLREIVDQINHEIEADSSEEAATPARWSDGSLRGGAQ